MQVALLRPVLRWESKEQTLWLHHVQADYVVPTVQQEEEQQLVEGVELALVEVEAQGEVAEMQPEKWA